MQSALAIAIFFAAIIFAPANYRIVHLVILDALALIMEVINFEWKFCAKHN